MIKTLQIARKTLLEAWREPQLLAVFIFFPALMLLLFYMAYGQGAKSMSSYLTVLVLNQDEGSQGARLVGMIQTAAFDGAPVFTVKTVQQRGQAEVALREHKAALLLTIPPEFSRSLASITPASATPASASRARVQILGDPGADTALFARSFLGGVLDDFSRQVSCWQKPDAVTYEFIGGTGTMSDFQFGIPGVLVFGILFGVITTAMLMVRETVGGGLKRLRLANVRAAELLGGVALAQFAATLIQLPLALAVAAAFGLASTGSLWLVGVIALLLSLAATGFGLITACFARSDGEAANLALVFLAPLVFLSNVLYPMPAAPLGRIAGQMISLYDVLPSTHAAEALRRVLIYGDGLAAVGYPLGMLALQTVLVLGLGAWLFERLRLRHAA